MLRSLGGGMTSVSSKMRGRDSARPSNYLLAVALAILSPVVGSVTAENNPSRDSDYDYDPPAAGSYRLPVIKPAADGALLDSNNKSVSLHDLTRGRITVLSFIYTRCAAPKACPYATGVLNQIHDLSVDDETLAKSMRLVSLSFDFEYDTPQRLADHSENVRDQKSGCDRRHEDVADGWNRQGN